MKSLAITSGKGGVGKTNVAANLALALGQQGKRVLLLDADLGLANLDIILGVDPGTTMADVLNGTQPLASILINLSERVSLVPASSGVLRAHAMSSAQRLRLGEQLDALARDYDLLLIDTGAGIGETVLFFNNLADGILLVTVPEPAALTDAYAMIKTLAHTCQRHDVAVLVNQAASASAAAAVETKLEQVSRRFLGVVVRDAGYLPMDPALQRAVGQRKAVFLAEPHAPFSRAIGALATKVEGLCGQRGPEPRPGVFAAWSENRFKGPNAKGM